MRRGSRGSGGSRASRAQREENTADFNYGEKMRFIHFPKMSRGQREDRQADGLTNTNALFISLH